MWWWRFVQGRWQLGGWALWLGAEQGRERYIESFQVFAKNRQFHLQNVKTPRAKSPWMAILGAKRHGCRLGSDPTALKHLNTFC